MGSKSADSGNRLTAIVSITVISLSLQFQTNKFRSAIFRYQPKAGSLLLYTYKSQDRFPAENAGKLSA
jgi:hypothetical protein